MNVTHTDGMWLAECDEPGLATEAETFDALTGRAWRIAPDLAEENSLGVEAANMRLLFLHEQAAPELTALWPRARHGRGGTNRECDPIDPAS